jgi:hypothetical protein
MNTYRSPEAVTKMAGMMLAIAAALFAAAASAYAADYSVGVSAHSDTALYIELTGYATGTAYIGSISDQKYQIEWGDGTVQTELSLSDVVDADGSFTATWDGMHRYAAEGTYDILVTLYHGDITAEGAISDTTSLQVTLD